jgi:hypothetical protein
MSALAIEAPRTIAKPLARTTKSPTKPAKAGRGSATAHSRGWHNSLRSHKAVARQRATAIAIGAVGVVLTGLSLTHQTHGVELITHSGPVEAGAMAVGIDGGFIGLKLATIMTVAERTRREVEKYANPAIVGTMLANAAMNAVGFASQAEGLAMQCTAVALGCAIPGMIYCIMRAGAAMFVDCHNRA